MKKQSQHKQLGQTLVAALGLAISISTVPMSAQAATVTWIGGSSWWSYGSNWDSGLQPAPGDDVNLTQSDAINRVVSYYNTLYPNSTDILGSLRIDATGTGTMTLNQTVYAHPLYADYEYIGYYGTGAYVQSLGTNTVTNDLYLGASSTGSGSYDLSGGTLSTGYEYIGDSGTGAFTQSGGTHTVTDLTLGYWNTGNGSYGLSGTGTLSANTETIGYYGTGTFIQSGGTNTVTKYLVLGDLGNGSYDLSGTGTLSVGSETFFTDNGEIIGYAGTGAFTQSGGTHTVTDLTLGYTSTGNGSYDLSGGTLSAGWESLFGDDDETIGYYGTGAFTQSGGTHTVTGLHLGYYDTGSGSYDLSGGTLSADSETIGSSGTGAFTQSGGTNTVTSSWGLVLGSTSTGSGDYDLSDTAVLSASYETIGRFGTGAFTQSGGTNTVTGNLSLGLGFSGSGSYNLSGTGALSAGYERIGNSGTGAFTQTGGTNTVTNTLYLGYDSTGNGGYDLSGTGTLSAGSEIIGIDGTGAFTQSGGTNVVTNNTLYLGYYSTGSGSYDLSGGNLSAGIEYIGLYGMGAFTQTGGTNTVTNTLYLGFGSTGSGMYTLSGGTLDVGGDIVNGAGTGRLYIDGGTLNVAGGDIDVDILTLGSASGASGSHTLSGTDTVTAGHEYIGNIGTGAFTQSGGTNTVTSALTLGNSGTGSGRYDLSGTGTLSAGWETIGNYGTGAFTQSGGTNTLTNNLYLGFSSTGNGTYTLSGGTLDVGGDIVNGAGTSTLNIDGGTLNVAGGDVDVDTLNIGEAGYLISGVGDNWFISGDFTNNSLQNSLWNTYNASLFFNGSGTQNMSLAGVDLGTGGSGYNDNFVWGEFSLGSGINLNILDSNNDGDAAFYAGVVSLADGVDLDTLLISYIFSDYNIYYNPLLAGNSYLNGQTFAFNGSGFLLPSAVPVPPAVWLFGSGLVGLIAVARRRRD